MVNENEPAFVLLQVHWHRPYPPGPPCGARMPWWNLLVDDEAAQTIAAGFNELESVKGCVVDHVSDWRSDCPR
jgi:hypothetical protein